jgi:hypothetical protein
VIEQVGARVMPDYGSVETGFIAFGCPEGSSADDLHLCSQYFAVIERERPIFESEPTNGPLVDALLVTTMGQDDGKIAINAELGDSARIERRDCGCLLGELGLTTHLSEIRSFEKLSSEGTTFARSSIARILEVTLPSRFGGTALDYQIVEEAASDGSTLLVLRVHPRVGEIDEAAIRATLLAELARESLVDAYYARLIERAASVTIERLPPLATPAGKVLPIHLARHADRSRLSTV